VSASQISLTWTDNCGNENGYEVERSDAGGGFTLISPLPAGATTFADSGLSRGVEYSYRVRAIRPGIASSYSNTATAIIEALQLTSAAYSVAEAGGAVMVTVTRTGVPQGEVTVEYFTESGTAVDGSDFTGVEGTLTFGDGDTSKTVVVTVAADVLVEGPETFTFTIRNPSGVGLGSPTVATVTIADDTVVTQPTNLAATVLGAALVQLAWQDNSGNETGFRIERKVGAGAFATLATVGAGLTTYNDTTATMDTAHVYRVVAVAGAGASDASNEATITIASGGKATISPKSLAFGKVKLGKSKAKTLKIKNTGKGVLQGFVGTLDPRFVFVSGAGGFTLARNKTHVVKVTYTPAVVETISSTLVITTTDPRKASNTVKVTAKGG